MVAREWELRMSNFAGLFRQERRAESWTSPLARRYPDVHPLCMTPALPAADILRVARSHGATSVRVFGSRARGENSPESDLDLLVTMEPDRSLLDVVAIRQDLEDLLGYPVDVVTEGGLSPYLRERILAEAVVLTA
jgi:predicted nucleotidyltransferase